MACTFRSALLLTVGRGREANGWVMAEASMGTLTSVPMMKDVVLDQTGS